MAPVKQTLTVGGLVVHAYSEPNATPVSMPISILFLMHGRTGSSQAAEPWVHAVLKEVQKYRASDEAAEDLIIVTFVRTPSVRRTFTYELLLARIITIMVVAW